MSTPSVPKPQFRPKLTTPAKKSQSSPFNRIKSAPVTSRKPEPNKRITQCSHVLKGAVWCVDCAKTFRNQARETYARSLRESQRGDVIRAAQENLAKALKEYALTNEGIAELEREYARLVSVNRPAEAVKISDRIKELRKEISDRNITSRKSEETRKARMTTALSHSSIHDNTYIQAPLDGKNKRTTAGSSFNLTNHTKERMELRSITEEEVASAFSAFTVVNPMGGGKWSVAGINGVTLYGFFEKRYGKMNFVITTVFRPEASLGEESGDANA
jgi:hypothetical protein